MTADEAGLHIWLREPDRKSNGSARGQLHSHLPREAFVGLATDVGGFDRVAADLQVDLTPSGHAGRGDGSAVHCQRSQDRILGHDRERRGCAEYLHLPAHGSLDDAAFVDHINLSIEVHCRSVFGLGGGLRVAEVLPLGQGEGDLRAGERSSSEQDEHRTSCLPLPRIIGPIGASPVQFWC